MHYYTGKQHKHIHFLFSFCTSQRYELPLLMALFMNSSYLTQESTFQQVGKKGHRQRCNFSSTNTFVPAGDVQGQGSADSAQVHKLSLNNITYFYGHRQTAQKDHCSDPGHFLYETNKYVHKYFRTDGVISLLMPKKSFL